MELPGSYIAGEAARGAVSLVERSVVGAISVARDALDTRHHLQRIEDEHLAAISLSERQIGYVMMRHALTEGQPDDPASNAQRLAERFCTAYDRRNYKRAEKLLRLLDVSLESAAGTFGLDDLDLDPIMREELRANLGAYKKIKAAE